MQAGHFLKMVVLALGYAPAESKTVIFGKDAQKAIALYDKYMNARYTRTDGYTDYTVTNINNRNTCFLRYDDYSFGIQIKLRGLK